MALQIQSSARPEVTKCVAVHNPETKKQKQKQKRKRKKGERIAAAAAEEWVGGGGEEVGRLVMRGGGGEEEEEGKKLLRKKGAVVSVSAELPHFLYSNEKLNKRAIMIAVDDLLTLSILP
jgi:hypothetical protein